MLQFFSSLNQLFTAVSQSINQNTFLSVQLHMSRANMKCLYVLMLIAGWRTGILLPIKTWTASGRL